MLISNWRKKTEICAIQEPQLFGRRFSTPSLDEGKHVISGDFRSRIQPKQDRQSRQMLPNQLGRGFAGQNRRFLVTDGYFAHERILLRGSLLADNFTKSQSFTCLETLLAT